jgi:hypothetical protein
MTEAILSEYIRAAGTAVERPKGDSVDLCGDSNDGKRWCGTLTPFPINDVASLELHFLPRPLAVALLRVLALGAPMASKHLERAMAEAADWSEGNYDSALDRHQGRK